MPAKNGIELSRTVRFCVSFAGPGPRPRSNLQPNSSRHNTFAGWPSMVGLGAHYELEVRCQGFADPITGYMINISEIDKAVRELGIPIIDAAVQTQSAAATTTQPARVLAAVWQALQSALQRRTTSIRWRLSPYYSLTMRASSPDRVLITQQFEFSASHRLHVDSLSPEANRKIFGKCNNANGHGHNYRAEPQVSVPLVMSTDAASDHAALTLQSLERIVDQTIIQRFDHTHLNRDTVEFAQLNPSVENIAKVCHDLLVEPIAQAGGKLERVTIWETEKTSCTYPVPE